MFREDRREQMIKVFNDTQVFYAENVHLIKAVKNAKTKVMFYDAEDYPELPHISKSGSVTVSKSRTFEAAMRLHAEHAHKKIAVLNFASATNPGGGVKSGSSAQEESLCRCSTLYPTINQRWLYDKYYAVNRKARNPLYTDACIYSHDIVICKSDDDIPQRLSESEFITVDIITCAAPNLSHFDESTPHGISDEKLLAIHTDRAKHILHVAACNGVDCLVLGAFGCGAFRNNPNIVARAFKNALEKYHRYFELIEFAVYCRDYETENYKAFKAVLG